MALDAHSVAEKHHMYLADARSANSIIGAELGCSSLPGVEPCCHFSRFTRSQPNAEMNCALNF
jgi:hypothetical protein